MENIHHQLLRTLRKESVAGKGDRGFHHSDAVKASEESRSEDRRSYDPYYKDQKKNK
jgi:hypothetical protein